MLQVLHGGASARPFVTHMNAMDMDLYLRIAPELYLKRCVVGGIERVFEINRNFRNEGVDSSHSPEFAMLEAYQAYTDYNGMAELTTSADPAGDHAVFGSTVVRHADGTEFDLGGTWRSITLYGALVRRAVGEEVTPDTDGRTTRASSPRGRRAGRAAYGPRQDRPEMFEKLVDHSLVAPTFVRDFPVETPPLTRDHREIPVDREVGPLSSAASSGHRLLRAGRPGGPARAIRRHRRVWPGRVTPRRWCSTRISCGRWSTECRRPAGWEWVSTDC